MGSLPLQARSWGLRSGVSGGVLIRIGSLRYGDYGLRTTAGRLLSFVCSSGLSRAKRRGGEGNNTQRFSCFYV